MERQLNSSTFIYSTQNRQTPKNDTNEPLEEETSQLWMIRRLKALLLSAHGNQSDGINEQFISDFILHQDITALRNFLMDSGLRRILFLCIYRVTVPIFDSLSDTIAATLQLTESKPRQIQKMGKISLKAETSQPSNLSQTAESKSKASTFETMKTSPKKIKKAEKTTKNVRKNKKSGKSTDQGSGDEADAISIQINDEDTKYADLYADLSAPEIAETSDVQETDGRETKSEKDSEEEATQKRKTVLGAEVPFQMQIDMMINLQTPSGTLRTVYWQDPEFRFENFILDSIVKAEKGRSLNVLGASSSGQQFAAALVEHENSAEFIDNLLRPRIYAYVTNPSPAGRTQLLIELSLYELKFISGDNLLHSSVVDRLQRALTIFSMIHILYVPTNRDWIHKALFHAIELTARVLATNLQQRMWNMLGEDCSDRAERKFTLQTHSESKKMAHEVRPLLTEYLRLGEMCMEQNTDEYVCLEKIRQCLTILDYIEEDFDKIHFMVRDMRDPRRDMTFDRTKLNEAKEIVRSIWSTFEESYFESSLESGNYEAMKNVYLQSSELIVKLKESIPPLDKYCL
ncbi:hypothetical protein Ddc_01441 [Ditylenchus destructor]|nr:hypothetical protein Ddc_01441 [Ditylenchus destructor]